MTEQHPLTDELCDQIVSSTPPLPCDQQDRVLSYDGRILDGMFEECFEEQKHQFRAVADWQLEQVIEWLRSTPSGEYVHFWCCEAEMDKDELITDLKKAMRPQENNR
jgi:hypothetical protein